MDIIHILQEGVQKAVKSLYDLEVELSSVQISTTRKEFEGDYTVVVFPFTKAARKKPEAIGEELGQVIVDSLDQVVGFNVIKGFLNLSLSDQFWLDFLADALQQPNYGHSAPNGKKVMVEFSSPNTNKPLHLGHIRNILLGWSCSQILDAAGYEVIKVQIINDRGIAICKSMLAWQKFGEGSTPESTGIKGDHLVGKYYVEFESRFKEEYSTWQQTDAAKEVYNAKKKADQSEEAFFKGFKNQYFNEHSALGKEAKEMLLKWEANDPDTRALWEQMNGWVYEGFNETYDKLGVSFDKLYYESDTYLLGKDIIEGGLGTGIFYRKEDQSVWIDLEAAKLDHKLVLRSDGTSVYMTQDIGTATKRFEEFGFDKMVYVVADEQNYHFKVLFEIMKQLGAPYAEQMHHLSYGMVELTTGRMKSREGTIVDADDLMADVITEAKKAAEERGALENPADQEQQDILRKIGLAALKFFILKVQPKKWMTFNPEESVDLQGHTGPYIQYSYVRVNKVCQRAAEEQIDLSQFAGYQKLEKIEKDLLQQVYQFPEIIQQAAASYEPSNVANYCYSLAKTYSKFYHDLDFFNAETDSARAFRLQTSQLVGDVLKKGMGLLGIEMPDRM